MPKEPITELAHAKNDVRHGKDTAHVSSTKFVNHNEPNDPTIIDLGVENGHLHGDEKNGIKSRSEYSSVKLTGAEVTVVHEYDQKNSQFAGPAVVAYSIESKSIADAMRHAMEKALQDGMTGKEASQLENAQKLLVETAYNQGGHLSTGERQTIAKAFNAVGQKEGKSGRS